MPIKIEIKVQPGAGRNEVAGIINGIWKIKVAAAPDRGKANKELIDFLSERLQLKKAQITIVKGETSHNKVIAIYGLDLSEISRRLADVE